MPGTYSNLKFHIIWRTYESAPIISAEIRARLHEYIGGIIKSEGGVPESVGGTADHVHVLASLDPNITISDFMRVVKAKSSRWARSSAGIKNFKWQDGYGIFSVSESQKNTVKKYIRDQEEHHRKLSFREEYVRFLKRHKVEFDERYI